jgi:retinol dehydrogenase-13
LKKSTPSRILLLSSVVHAGSDGNRPEVHLEDLNYNTREFSRFGAYAEAKVANVLYAKELAERLEGTGVTAVSIHPGWARSNFGSGGGAGMRVLMALMRPFTRFMTESNYEAAQTSLHCLLHDDVPNHSGAYYSQRSYLYRDSEYRDGGWPMDSPNPNAKNMDIARKLVDRSYELVGLSKPLGQTT